MKIRLLHSIASPTWSYAIGDVIETSETFTPTACPEDIARKWLSSGIAEPVPETKVETASLKRKK